jgi:neutral ceramidase
MGSNASRQVRFVLVLLLALLAPGAASGQGGGLRVGAARIDITPPSQPEATIRDRLYVHAIVIDNGATRAALINADQVGISEAAWEAATREIARELNAPVENIVLSPTHAHSNGGPNSFLTSPALPGAFVDAVRQARGRMRPAVMGFGRGSAALNVNRDAIHPQTRQWYQGPNPEGTSDKAVSVVSFWTPEGAPIAAYFSYAMHPNHMYQTGYVSADFPGEASRFMREVLGDDFVPVFVQAPSGDQNPLYVRIGSPVPQTTRQVVLPPSARPAPPAAGAGANVPAGVQARPDTVLRVGVGVEETMRAEGVILGQEVLRVMFLTRARTADVRIAGAQKMVTCPGRTRLDNAREGVQGRYEDGPPVSIRVSALRIGPAALVGINAEVYTDIGLRIKGESPLANVMPVSQANGSAGSGYVPDDASFSHDTFQVLGSRLKPGCAENGIAGAALELVGGTMD